MTAADSKAAVDRVAAKVRDLGDEDFGTYAFLALGFLAWNAPDALHFILDRADEQLSTSPATEGGQS